MSMLERIKKRRRDLENRQKEEFERKDPSPYSVGSVLIKEKIPKGVEIWRPGVGEHIFDIIPWIGSPEHPYAKGEWVVDEETGKEEWHGPYCWDLVLQIYRNVGLMKDHFVSPYANFKEPDPIAEYIQMTDLKKEDFNKLRAKKRVFYLVWVHDNDEEEKKGVQIWEVAHWFIYEQLKELSMIPKDGGQIPYMDYTKKGKQIWVNIRQEGSFEGEDGTKVDAIRYSAPKFLDRPASIPDWVLEQSFALDTVIHMHPSYEDIYKSFHGREYTGETVSVPQKQPVNRPKMATAISPVQDEESVGECPSGHTFGVDIDKFPEDCDVCPQWDNCSDEADRIKETSSEQETIPDDEPEPEKPEKPVTGIRKRGRLGKR